MVEKLYPSQMSTAWKTRIREGIDKLGMTDAEFARRCGIKPTMIADIFRKTGSPRIDTIAKIANGLGLTISQLYEGGEAPTTVLQSRLVTAENDMLVEGKTVTVTLDFMAGDMVTVRVEGSQYAPRFNDGDMLCGPKQSPEFADNLNGSECIVKVRGKCLLKSILRGSEPGRYNLRSLESGRPQNDLMNVQIEWIAPIRMIVRQ